MKSHHLYVCVFCICFLVLSVGCGGLKRLEGRVTFEDDGSPLDRGSVVFVQGNMESRALIRPDGTFTVGTHAERDGIPSGEFQVYISGADVQQLDNRGNAVFVLLIDEKYTLPQTSGIVYNSATSPSPFNITVSRPQ